MLRSYTPLTQGCNNFNLLALLHFQPCLGSSKPSFCTLFRIYEFRAVIYSNKTAFSSHHTEWAGSQRKGTVFPVSVATLATNNMAQLMTPGWEPGNGNYCSSRWNLLSSAKGIEQHGDKKIYTYRVPKTSPRLLHYWIVTRSLCHYLVLRCNVV